MVYKIDKWYYQKYFKKKTHFCKTLRILPYIILNTFGEYISMHT